MIFNQSTVHSFKILTFRQITQIKFNKMFFFELRE